MSLGRRRVVRHSCRWNVEVTDLRTGAQIQGITRNVGVYGCFLETPTPLMVERSISLRIAHNGSIFTAPAEVTFAVEGEGMGVVFGEITSGDYHLLEEWLKVEPEVPSEFAQTRSSKS